MGVSDLTGDWASQLLTLKGLTALTGTLHEAQVLQLKMWGAVSFPHVPKGKWEIRVDTDGRTVTYALRSPRRSRPPAEFAKLVAALDGYVHWLLGDEWVLCVADNGKAIYQGERRVAAETNLNEQRKSRANPRKGDGLTD